MGVILQGAYTKKTKKKDTSNKADLRLPGYPPLLAKHFQFKRYVDVVFSITNLVLLMPLLLTIGVFIKFSTNGSVLYRSRRIGKNGKPFSMLKFRTMLPDAHQLMLQYPGLSEQFMVGFKLKNDHRVTRGGKFLRRTGLDELPQLINILKGEMSFVGPRPILPEEINRTVSQERFAVLPGLTGLWQIRGKNDLSYASKDKWDRYYVRHYRLGLDWKILLDTIPAIIKGRGFGH